MKELSPTGGVRDRGFSSSDQNTLLKHWFLRPNCVSAKSLDGVVTTSPQCVGEDIADIPQILQRKKANTAMISPRQYIVLSITCFAVSFSLLIAGFVFQVMGMGGSNPLMLAGFPFNFIGILAMWFSQSLKLQSERLDRLEAQLLARTQA
jgi:hypothetical protein